jgi:DNA-binding transcriptional ArsR family regulator
VSEDCDEAELLALLEDEYARAILTATSAEPMSANTLSERCDASVTTIYRRIDRLLACGLLDERLQPQPDGNHYRVYTSRLGRFSIAFEDGERVIEVEERDRPPAEDTADKFTRMWREL